MHLTNDAVQDRNEEYGKYEQGNKVSQKDFATYLQSHMNVDFYKHIYPRMKESMKHTLEAFWVKHKQLNTYHKINHKSPLLADSLNHFELLGYDFMIDEDL